MTAPLDFIDLKTQYAALKPRIAERMQRVLDHGQYIMGPEVEELEQQLAAHTGARHCITVASGTEALLISLMALGIQPGDEVITTSADSAGPRYRGSDVSRLFVISRRASSVARRTSCGLCSQSRRS